MTSIETVIDKFETGKPTLLVDADEVLLRFVEHLEMHCARQGYDIHLDSFRLSGNIIHRETQVPAESTTVRELISSFFDEHVDTIPAVDGAANALQALSNQYQIAVLTNVPERCRDRRENSLRALGFPYPVLSNSGEKGPAVKAIQAGLSAPITFIDDLPPQLKSVSSHAPETYLIHFIADPRLAKLIPKADAANVRIDAWPDVSAHLQTKLQT